MENSKSIISNTGYKGITFDKSNGLFQAQLVIYNKKLEHNLVNRKPKLKWFQTTVWCKKFDTLKEAIKVREDFIKSLF